MIQELCRLLEIHKKRASPYHPICEGAVERLNGTVKGLLKTCVDKEKDWDMYLPKVMMAYNSSVHESTGFFTGILDVWP